MQNINYKFLGSQIPFRKIPVRKRA